MVKYRGRRIPGRRAGEFLPVGAFRPVRERSFSGASPMTSILRAFGWALFLGTLAATTAGAAPSLLEPPLPRTPYRIIRQAHPDRTAFTVRVQVYSPQKKPQIITPFSPARNEVWAAACKHLQRTQFRCLDPRERKRPPDYIVRIEYDIYLDEFRYRLWNRRRDDYSDDLYAFRWSLFVFRPGGGAPIFDIRKVHEDHRLWSDGMGYWIRRFFSE